jgi:uncharacterized protein DUF2798
MEGKARFIFPVVMAGVVVFIVAAVVTFLNTGTQPGFVGRWMRAFLVGWPVAAVVVFAGMPVVRRITLRIVALIEGTG